MNKRSVYFAVPYNELCEALNKQGRKPNIGYLSVLYNPGDDGYYDSKYNGYKEEMKNENTLPIMFSQYNEEDESSLYYEGSIDAQLLESCSFNNNEKIAVLEVVDDGLLYDQMYSHIRFSIITCIELNISVDEAKVKYHSAK